MINKNKFRIIGDVADFNNGPAVLDLREIGKARKLEEKQRLEKDLINLRSSQKNAEANVENAEANAENAETNAENEEANLLVDQVGAEKAVEQIQIQELQKPKVQEKNDEQILVQHEDQVKPVVLPQAEIVAKPLVIKDEKPKVKKMSFSKNWLQRQAEKKKIRNAKIAEIKRIKLEKQQKEQELKKARILEQQNIKLKKELEKREAKKLWLLAKQEAKRKKLEEKKALQEKILLQKQQLKLKKESAFALARATADKERILEKQRLELELKARQEELRLRKIAEKQELELRLQLEQQEKEERKLIEQQRKSFQEQQKPKVDYLLLFKNRFGKSFRFSLIFFVLVCAILMSGIKGLDFFSSQAKNTKSKILSDAMVAYQYMGSATNSATSKDFEMASYKFGVAGDRFLNAQKDLNQYGEVLTSVLKIMPGASAVRSGDNLLSAGANLSQAGEYLSSAVTPFNDLGSFISLPSDENSNNQKTTLTELLSEATNNLNLAIGKLDAANSDLKNVKVSDLPSDVAPKIATIKDNLPTISSDLKTLTSYSDNFLQMLGHKGAKRYLVLFENNRELRPTGGFMGTYALVDIDSGKIKNIKIEGPYNLDGNLMEKIIAPEPLRLIQVKLFLRDSNWFLDFPMSAKKVMSMYEKSGGPTVDGVFTVTGNVMEALLGVTGEIDMPEYGTAVNADNFFDKTQFEVEYDYDKQENEPKKFLADLFPVFLDRLSNLSKDKWLETANVMYKMLDQKDIMMYFNDEKLENFVKEFNWTGEIKNPSKDYLSTVITNIGGGKTDDVIDQNIFHEAEIQDDGSVIDTITVTRIHNGDPNDMWTSVKNMAYMRFYVPLGSEMIEARGFDKEFWGVLRPLEEGSNPDPLISNIENNTKVNNENGIRIMEEGGKTVFANWIGIECGQAKTMVIKYRLPFKVQKTGQDAATSYAMFFQKQPGTKAFETTSILKYPIDYYVNWKYSSDNMLTEVSDGLQYRTNLNKDKAYAVVFVK
ncbi:MAG: DUF4012 domain-containing protein [Patescibacteria group bacterium]|jgi:hypothetical protein